MFRFFICLVISIVLYSCSSSKKMTAVQDDCSKLPKLRWQNETVIQTDSNFLRFTADLIKAAQYDVTAGKKINDSIGIGFQSQLAKRLSIVSTSAVSQEFWEADIAFRQVVCLLDNKLNDKSASIELKQALQKQYIEILQAQKEYLGLLQKKTSVSKITP